MRFFLFILFLPMAAFADGYGIPPSFFEVPTVEVRLHNLTGTNLSMTAVETSFGETFTLYFPPGESSQDLPQGAYSFYVPDTGTETYGIGGSEISKVELWAWMNYDGYLRIVAETRWTNDVYFWEGFTLVMVVFGFALKLRAVKGIKQAMPYGE